MTDKRSNSEENAHSRSSFQLWGFRFEGPTTLAIVVLGIAVAGAAFWNWPSIVDRFRDSSFADIVPQLESPRNGSTFYHYPRWLSLRWRRLAGAESYVVEVEAHDPRSGWFPHPGRSRYTTEEQMLRFEFVGSQPGRWRVIARDTDGTTSKPSRWWDFSFDEPAESKRTEPSARVGWEDSVNPNDQ